MSDKMKAVLGWIAVIGAVLAGTAGVIAGISLDELASTLSGAGAIVAGVIGFIKSLFNRPA